MNATNLVALFGLIIAIIVVCQLQMKYTWPIARPALQATWPMVPGKIEGFVGSQGLVSIQGITTPELKAWLPSPEVLTKSNGAEEKQRVMDGAAPYEAGIGKPFKSYDLLPKGKPEPRVAGGPTAQRCYNQDFANTLMPGGTYRQFTNNFIHGYPDSCSAPYHELILNFYKNPVFSKEEKTD
jgi:hypothetical protein